MFDSGRAMKKFDIIIVGAGPGGLAAAYEAACRGLSVALIERRSKLSPITRACSEGLLVDEEYYGDSVSLSSDDGYIRFKNSDTRIKYTGALREVPYFTNVSANGGRMKMVREDNKAIHLVYDKGRCLEENLEVCIKAGVIFLPNETVVELNTESEQVFVRTNKDVYKARFLIAADGHNSVCARLLGFNKKREFYGTLIGMCWHLKGFEPPEPAHIHLVEGKGGPSVVCFCPRVNENEYNVMISSFSKGYKYLEKFEQVRTKSALSRMFNKKIEIVRKSACILNLLSPIKDPCRDNIFVVGDAAWMGQTSNTHAALCGVKAVDSICSALNEKKVGNEVVRGYRDWWNDNFVPHIKEPGVNMFEELESEEIDELLSFMPDSILGSLEPNRAQKFMGSFFQKLLPEVQKKSPELFERIVLVQQKSSKDVWERKRKMGFPVNL